MTAHAQRSALGSATIALVLAAGAVGCRASTSDDGFDFSTESNGSGGPGTSGGSGGGTSSGGGEGTTAALDSSGSDGAGSSSTGEAPPAVPCSGIDLVFVVDDSVPMIEEQLRLQSAALAFVQQVAAGIPTLVDGIGIGVVTTDDPVFVQANAAPCGPYEGGNPWMLSSSTVLATELECALGVGTAGSPNERPVDMLLDALADEAIAPGGVHDGFLRDDALLVVVLVTNEEDELEPDTAWGSAGDPADWVEALAGRKGGYLHDVVVLSLLGTPPPNACPEIQWDGTEGAQVSPRLIELTESFPQGVVGDICAQEYATFLLGVVPGVVAACAGYTPP